MIKITSFMIFFIGSAILGSCQQGFKTITKELPSLQARVPDSLQTELEQISNPTELLAKSCLQTYRIKPYISESVIVLPIVSTPSEELNYGDHFGQVYESLKFSTAPVSNPIDRKLPERPVSFNYYPDQFSDSAFQEKLRARYPNQDVSAIWLNFSMTIESLLDSENNHPKPFLRPSGPCEGQTDPNTSCATVSYPPDEFVFLNPDTSQNFHLCDESFALPFKFKFQEQAGFGFGKAILHSPYHDSVYGRLVYIWIQLPDNPTWYQIGYFWRHDERFNLSSFNNSGRTPSSIKEPTATESLNRPIWFGLAVTALILLFGVTYLFKPSPSNKDQ